MKTIKRAAIVIATIAAIASAPATADSASDPNGYIRIGDECYLNMGYPLPVFIKIPCPREILGDN
ncbi:MAG: hypothetical protein KGZ65_10910 [Sphingomonadales bacterium]|nr:hypothetical protein [Sphingomonadaceae bacterium]MBS3931736.1 hypothetical protein [Sphingomonadales bacterium]MBX9644733.1 hypothetical protein [Novosphingobium sp.]